MSGEAAPRKGPPLGLRLGIVSSIIVVGLMGVLVFFEQRKMDRDERLHSRSSMETVLAILAEEIGKQVDAGGVEKEVEEFLTAQQRTARDPIRVAVLGPDGGIVAGTAALAGEPLRVSMEVRSDALPGGAGTLVMEQSGGSLEREVVERTGRLLLDVAITALVLLVALHLATRALVGRPLEHLLATVDRMEQGYWRNVDVPGGAWEMRWLAWKFQGLGERLDGLLKSIVGARALPTPGTEPAPASCRGLPGDPGRKAGCVPAITVATIEQRLAHDPRSDAGWSRRISARIVEALEEHGVEALGIEFRMKDATSAWWKMRSKSLRLEDLEDLFAFRIIVPSEQDCYAAVRIIHSTFAPDLLRFKDYVRSPKPNGYRGIHTCVADGDGERFEVQVRSTEMHEQASHGTAAHSRYKAWIELAGMQDTARRGSPGNA